MKERDSSSAQRGSTRQLVEDEKTSGELGRLRQENMKLAGEITIIRQNMIVLEKQNYVMKEQRSQALVSDLRAADVLKKEVCVLKVENRIRENQMRAFKKTRVEASIDIKWALSRANSEISFSLHPFELRRLRFLKDFFYSDFCQLDTQQVVGELNGMQPRFREFLDFYVLFSCKVDVFKEFFCMVFMNPEFPEEKAVLFNTLPLDWLLNFNDESFIGLIKEYTAANYRHMLLFFLRIVEERPFLLNILVTRDMFTDIAQTSSRMARRVVSEVCRRGGLSLVDHTNIHHVSQTDLRMLYQDSYFDVEM